MGWPKGKPRKPKQVEPVSGSGEMPSQLQDAIEERERVLRMDRDEPASRGEGELRAESALRADPISDDDLAEYLDIAALESKLPSPPPSPGWHFFWASTTNQQTPVQMYIRLGYVFVHPDEIPEWKYMKTHSAQFSCEALQCNEMILMKTPEARYKKIMTLIHHDKPQSEAERLLVNVEMLKQEVGHDSQGRALVREEGDLAALVDRKIRSGIFE